MKMAVLGCGTMATALVLPAKEFDTHLDVWTYTPSGVRAKSLAEKIDGSVLKDIKDLSSFHFIMLACKPQHLDTLMTNIGGLHNGQTLISILAGVKIATLQKILGMSSVFRLMPNTPARIKQGISIVTKSPRMIPEHTLYLTKLFGASAKIFTVNEDALDIITPVSGSGPAFIFEWARLMEAYLVKGGISPPMSHEIVTQTFLGSAKFMKSQSFEFLREKVATKKGVTHEALKEFWASDLEGIVQRALTKAYKKCLELSQKAYK